MRVSAVLVSAIAAVSTVCVLAPARSQCQEAAGIRVRVRLLKQYVERTAGPGPALVGPQEALELEWRVLNTSGQRLEISPEILRIRVLNRARPIRVTTEWEREITVNVPSNGQVLSTRLVAGVAELPDRGSMWVRGSTKRLDGSPFEPGDYVLRLALREPTAVVDAGYPIQLRIVDLSSPERQRQFHMLEGSFYERSDPTRALEHYRALAAMPSATWSDSLPLAWAYSERRRYREAADVFRRILPDLTRGLTPPAGDLAARQLREAAKCFAIVGDVAVARELLRLEGRTPAKDIDAEIQRLKSGGGTPQRSIR